MATAISLTLLAMALPNLQALRRPYALRTAARQIEAAVIGARSRAIARNAPHRITFDTTANTYTIERQTAPGVFTPEGGVQSLPRGITLGLVVGTPVIDSRGMFATDVSIPVSMNGTGTKTVTINVLGRTTIS